MARSIDEFVLAWNALAGKSLAQGWRGIPVSPSGSCRLMAGRSFPDNEESLLAGFLCREGDIPKSLPEGAGFAVTRTSLSDDGRAWIALTRKKDGNFDLFVEMVGDVAGAMDAVASEGETRILKVLVDRVRAWQEFMRKDLLSLGVEAETGLVGELFLLRKILEAGIPPHRALESWTGPLDGVQDFNLGSGAIEVKTTVASIGFPAKIGSMEQLDDSILCPLFVCGVRLSSGESGQTLPDLVKMTGEALVNDAEAERLFLERLLKAGYFDAHAARYSRRFFLQESFFLQVTNDFPRIVSGNIPKGIRKVMYEIDLDRVPCMKTDLDEVLKKLGEK